MKLPFKQSKPAIYVPPELQAYYQPAAAGGGKRKWLKWVVLTVVFLAVVVGMGLWLGSLLSHRNLGNDGQKSQQSHQRVNQSPQASQPPVTPAPQTNGLSGQTNTGTVPLP